jgi:predicted ATPase/DNA-binding winged helix-turn-helix (wHTH) protein
VTGHTASSAEAESRRKFCELAGTASCCLSHHEPEREYEIAFGPFVLIPGKRRLLKDGVPVPLGSRAFDVLVALVERAGKLVSKRELMDLVWPHIVVVEANLTVHVTAVRRALGDGEGDKRYIVNIPGRGYRFVAPLSVTGDLPACMPEPATTEIPNNLPLQLTPLVGRDALIGRLVQCLSRQRLLTLVGPAGVGKTAVALEVAQQLLLTCQGGVWLVDLAQVTDPSRLIPAVAKQLGVAVRADNALGSIVAALREKAVLLVLDNCAHLADAAAVMAEELLQSARLLRILATSRQPLRACGEHVHWLPPLQSPPASLPLDTAEALRFSAVQLLVERAGDFIHGFELSDADAQTAGAICRKLDGIPLAIEIAASRVNVLGLRGLAAYLDDGSGLLGCEHRVTLPRHRSISAALDWSYALLSEEEQRVLRGLAIFEDDFTLSAACAVMSDRPDISTDITDTIVGLVGKCLIMTEACGEGEVHFRLLEMTRLYAEAKLLESDEIDMIRRRHAVHSGNLLLLANSRREATNHSIMCQPIETGRFRRASYGQARRAYQEEAPVECFQGPA